MVEPSGNEPPNATVPEPRSEQARGISDRRFPGTPLSSSDIVEAAQELGVEASHIRAVLHVESKGSGFQADRRPKILYERHIFSRLTGGKFDNESISSPTPGGYADGLQYDRLAHAISLDLSAGLAACSYGLGQVMGFNHEVVGYGTVEEFVGSMIDGEGPQLAAMCAFIKRKGLEKALLDQNWSEFAQVYNGPAFKKHEYDTRLEAAFADVDSDNAINLELRRDQMFLLYLGFNPGPIDGLYGERTQAALAEFQERNRGQVRRQDGERDEETARLLERLVAELVESQRGDLV